MKDKYKNKYDKYTYIFNEKSGAFDKKLSDNYSENSIKMEKDRRNKELIENNKKYLNSTNLPYSLLQTGKFKNDGKLIIKDLSRTNIIDNDKIIQNLNAEKKVDAKNLFNSWIKDLLKDKKISKEEKIKLIETISSLNQTIPIMLKSSFLFKIRIKDEFNTKKNIGGDAVSALTKSDNEISVYIRKDKNNFTYRNTYSHKIVISDTNYFNMNMKSNCYFLDKKGNLQTKTVLKMKKELGDKFKNANIKQVLKQYEEKFLKDNPPVAEITMESIISFDKNLKPKFEQYLEFYGAEGLFEVNDNIEKLNYLEVKYPTNFYKSYTGGYWSYDKDATSKNGKEKLKYKKQDISKHMYELKHGKILKDDLIKDFVKVEKNKIKEIKKERAKTMKTENKENLDVRYDKFIINDKSEVSPKIEKEFVKCIKKIEYVEKNNKEIELKEKKLRKEKSETIKNSKQINLKKQEVKKLKDKIKKHKDKLKEKTEYWKKAISENEKVFRENIKEIDNKIKKLDKNSKKLEPLKQNLINLKKQKETLIGALKDQRDDEINKENKQINKVNEKIKELNESIHKIEKEITDKINNKIHEIDGTKAKYYLDAIANKYPYSCHLLCKHQLLDENQFLEDLNRAKYIYDKSNKIQDTNLKKPLKLSKKSQIELLENWYKDLVGKKKIDSKQKIISQLTGSMGQRINANIVFFAANNYKISNKNKVISKDPINYTIYQNHYERNKTVSMKRINNKEFLYRSKTKIPFLLDGDNIVYVNLQGKMSSKPIKEISKSYRDTFDVINKTSKTPTDIIKFLQKESSMPLLEINFDSRVKFDNELKPHYSQVSEIKHPAFIKYTGEHFSFMERKAPNWKWDSDSTSWDGSKYYLSYVYNISRNEKEQSAKDYNKKAVWKKEFKEVETDSIGNEIEEHYSTDIPLKYEFPELEHEKDQKPSKKDELKP